MKNTNNLKISARNLQTYDDVAIPLSIATQRQLRNCLIHFCLLLSFSLVLFSFSFRSAAAQSSRHSPNPYTLQLGDCINVSVEGYPEYSKPISVCLDGFIPQHTPTHRKIQVEAKRRLSHGRVEDTRLVGADIPLRSNDAVSVLSWLQQRSITSPEHLSKRYWASPIISSWENSTLMADFRSLEDFGSLIPLPSTLMRRAEKK